MEVYTLHNNKDFVPYLFTPDIWKFKIWPEIGDALKITLVNIIELYIEEILEKTG